MSLKEVHVFILVFMFGLFQACNSSNSNENSEEKKETATAVEKESQEPEPSQLGIMGVWVGPHLYRVQRVLRRATEAGGKHGVAVVSSAAQGGVSVRSSSQLVFQLTIGLKEEWATGYLQWAVPGEIIHLANAHYASMGQKCKTQVHFGLDGAIHGQVVCPQLDCTTGNGWFFKTMCPYGKEVSLKAHFTGLK